MISPIYFVSSLTHFIPTCSNSIELKKRERVEHQVFSAATRQKDKKAKLRNPPKYEPGHSLPNQDIQHIDNHHEIIILTTYKMHLYYTMQRTFHKRQNQPLNNSW